MHTLSKGFNKQSLACYGHIDRIDESFCVLKEIYFCSKLSSASHFEDTQLKRSEKKDGL